LNTKTSTVLILVQTSLLLLLFGKVIAIDNRMLAAERTSNTTPANDFFDLRPAADLLSERQSLSNDSFPDEYQLRQIIREELIAHVDVHGMSKRREEAVVVPSPGEVVDYQRRRDSVQQQLEYFSSVGRISAIEMHTLQRDIATLDNASRREMLGRLTRAMNSGEFEGNL